MSAVKGSVSNMIDLSRDLQLNILQNINIIIVLDESGISSSIGQYRAIKQG